MTTSTIKSILATFLDALTRNHTTHLVGAATSYQDLKRGVLEFAANNVTSTPVVASASSGGSPMNIGAFLGTEDEQ